MEVLNTKQNVFQTGKSAMALMTVLMVRMKIAVFVVSFRSNRALPSKILAMPTVTWPTSSSNSMDDLEAF